MMCPFRLCKISFIHILSNKEQLHMAGQQIEGTSPVELHRGGHQKDLLEHPLSASRVAVPAWPHTAQNQLPGNTFTCWLGQDACSSKVKRERANQTAAKNTSLPCPWQAPEPRSTGAVWAGGRGPKRFKFGCCKALASQSCELMVTPSTRSTRQSDDRGSVKA